MSASDLTALDSLVAELGREFAAEASGKRIAAMLRSYGEEHDDWRTFALFADGSYTRNLVYRDETFELMILCWGPGHESPIHNHEGQDCWMSVLEGEMEELRYTTPAEVRPGPLRPTDSAVFRTDRVAFIHDDVGLHLVRPADRERSAISLHLYAGPYDACNTYCPETGAITRKALINYSERGELCAEGA